MNIRTRIKQAREAVGINKSELARKVGVLPSSSIQWETKGKGGTTPSVDNLARVAVALNARFEWLATGRGPMWYSDKVSESPPIYANRKDLLSTEELELLTFYRRRKLERRAALLEFLKKY